MTKLIRADLARMIKTKSFWICGGLAAGLILMNFLMDCKVNAAAAQSLGATMFDGNSNVMFFAAIFAALFLGTDYSNGTIRNKMSVGHGRCSIYFSNLITSSIGGVIYILAGWAVILVSGMLLGGKLGMAANDFALRIVISLLAMISACALFTLAGMLISVKSSAVVVIIVGVMVLLMGAAAVLSLLDAPEYFTGGIQITADGVMQPMEPELNSLYVRGTMRVFLQTLCDVLPSGQAMQLELDEPHTPELMPLYSIGLTAAVTVIGAAAFRRKDLK